MSSPSPWRPRLVQEGKPIYGGDNDHSMDECDHQSSANTRTTQTQHQYDRQTAAAGPSSLARAAGGTLPVRKPHISTKLVVNGDTSHANKDDDDDNAMAESPPRNNVASHLPPPRRKSSPIRMRLVVGEESLQNQQQQQYTSHYEHVTQPQHFQQQQQHVTHDFHSTHHQYENGTEQVERMEGVEHHGTKGPLVVMDGANIAYAYADAMGGFTQGHRAEPDARGIQVAANYFLSMHVRVLVVLPATWFRAKPRAGDESHGNAMMETPQMEVLKDLKTKGLLVAAPPRDDDDAYALTIARREDTRSHSRGGGGGFVLSCDMFRDAVQRDVTGDLREWLTKGSASNGPGRISFAFCDMGSTDDYGDREMDFVPNPRHPLVGWIENEHRKQTASNGYSY